MVKNKRPKIRRPFLENYNQFWAFSETRQSAVREPHLTYSTHVYWGVVSILQVHHCGMWRGKLVAVVGPQKRFPFKRGKCSSSAKRDPASLLVAVERRQPGRDAAKSIIYALAFRLDGTQIVARSVYDAAVVICFTRSN